MLPAAAMLIALAEPLVSLYRVGAFKASDVPQVAEALRLWGAGLIFFACMMFVLKTFYSLKDTRTPMLANLALTPVQIGLYVLLSTGAASWDGLGLNGIPIADGVFYALLLATLLLLMRRRIGGFDMRGVGASLGRMLIASVIGGAVAWAIAELLAPPVPRFGPAVVQVAAGGAAGLAVAFAAGRLMRVREVAMATAMLSRALGRKAPKSDGES
jgi:putative peptidoglycan lipid II flippase